MTQELVSRISSTSLVCALYHRYQSIKEYNSLLKVSIETAESSTNRLLRPVFKILESKLHLEEKATKVLSLIDLVENKTNEIKSTAIGLIEGSKNYLKKKKRKVFELFIDEPRASIVDVSVNMIKKNRKCNSQLIS